MEQVRSENYSKAELAVLRDYIVVNANELAEQMERDADGYLIYKGDMNQAAVEAMQQVGQLWTPPGLLSAAEGDLFFGAAQSDLYDGVLFPIFHGSKLQRNDVYCK